jgi:hypothetical protein
MWSPVFLSQELCATKGIWGLDPNRTFSFLFLTLPSPPPTNTWTWFWAATGCKWPYIFSGTSVLKQPCFLFSFATVREFNGLPLRGWHTTFCNSYLCKRPPLREPACFVQTGRDDHSVCLNKQVPLHGRNQTIFLEKPKSKSDKEAMQNHMNLSSDTWFNMSSCHLMYSGGVTVPPALGCFPQNEYFFQYTE